MTKDLQKRVVFGALALAIFLPFLVIGGVAFQIFTGILAMIAAAEILKMKGLDIMSVEGCLTMFAAFVLTLPLENYIPFLPTDGNYMAYTLVVFGLLGATVWSKGTYHFDDAVFPIAASFYVGTGFHSLVLARSDSFSKVLFALFIVWATDIGAYMIGRQYGRRKLLPEVSPNKTIEGSLGGVLSAVVIAIIFLIIQPKVANGYHFIIMLLLVIVFSVFGQFGDLVESSLKRHYSVKDSGKIIPGHGGILDRFDSLLFVFPIMHLFGLF